MIIIEHIWDALELAVQKRSPPPHTLMDLWTALKPWCQFPPALLQTLFESMPHRVAALLHACGGPTGYRQVYQFLLLFSVLLDSLHYAKISVTKIESVKETLYRGRSKLFKGCCAIEQVINI